MKTTNVDNYGPASIIIVNGEKDLEVLCASIIANKDVLENPFNFPTQAESHTCEFDSDKKIARRKYDGRVEKANFEIMSETRNTRKQQGRSIQVQEKSNKEIAGSER